MFSSEQKTAKQCFWVYMLLCDNGAYYTGYTQDVERRYQEHLKGTDKCKYTRSFKPVKLVQSWMFSTKSEALKAEKKIKTLSKEEKTRLVHYPERLIEKLTLEPKK